MHNSIITKKIIAHSLKKIMLTTPFQKISIRDIMSDAEIRRQTFYDYFQDKYELLTWIYEQETRENIGDYLDYEHWTRVINRLLNYFYENKVFYYNALLVPEQNSFNHYFFEHTHQLLLVIMGDMLAKEHKVMAQADQDFFASFYSHAFVGITTAWVMAHCDTPVNTLSEDIQRQLTDALKSSLERSQEG